MNPIRRRRPGSSRHGEYSRRGSARYLRVPSVVCALAVSGLILMLPPSVLAANAGASGTARHANSKPPSQAQWYSTLFGGSHGDAAHAVAVDRSGNIYLAGDTVSPNFPTHDAVQAHLGGHTQSSVESIDDEAGCIGSIGTSTNFAGCFENEDRDAFVVKLSPGGRVIYSTYLGGNGLDDARAITVDAEGNAYVAGYTRSVTRDDICCAPPAADFPVLRAFKRGFAHDSCLAGFGGCQDAFVAKLDPRGRLLFSTYLGGRQKEGNAALFQFNSGDDVANAIAVNQGGDIYVAGETDSVGFPGTSGGPVYGAFVSKLAPRGNGYRVVSTYLQTSLSGAESSPSAYGLTIDARGDVLVAGASFLLKLSPSLKPVYALGLHGEASGVAADRWGNAYVTGTWDPEYVNSKSFPTVHAVQSRPGGGMCRYDSYGMNGHPCTDAFVLKADPRGTTLYSTLLGGSSDDEARAIAVDRAGSAHVAGITGGNFPLKTPVQADFGGGAADAFLVKIAPGGDKMAYSTYLGGGGADLANAVALTPSGNPILAGQTDSGDFPISSNGSRTSVSESDASRIFVSRLPVSPRLLVRHVAQRGAISWVTLGAVGLVLLLLVLGGAAWYLRRRAVAATA
jgi:Beta-propeller repeat